MAGVVNSTAANNVALGYMAGSIVDTGANNNIFIGYQAADNLTTGANNIIIGHDIDAPSATGSNQMSIGNLIYATGVNGTGTNISTGRIGIGITSPTRLLSVNGAMKLSPTTNPTTPTAGDIYIDSAAANALKYHDGSSWITVGAGGGSGDFLANGTVPMTGQFRSIAGSSSAPGISFAGDTDNGIFAPVADNIAMTTSGSEKLRILANGNVGIGTSTPSVALDVNGNFRIAGQTMPTLMIENTKATSSREASLINFKGQGGSDLWYLGSDADGNGNHNFYIQDRLASSKTKFLIDATGNTGIGVTTPTRLLHVAGPIKITPTANPGTPTAGDIFVDSAASNSLKYHNGTSWVSLAVGGTGDFLADGTVPMTGALRHFAGTAAAPGLTFNGDTANGIFAPVANNLGFTTSGSEKLRVLANGNVGVGTTAPTEKLHVLGNLRVQGSTDCTLGNGAGGTNCSSDIRLKNHVEPIDNALVKILSLRGVEFDWNEKSQSPGRHDIGVIAQDVETVFPTAVIEDPATGFKKVDYAVLVAPVIQAFKDVYERLTDLVSASKLQSVEISSLQAESADLKVQVNRSNASATKASHDAINANLVAARANAEVAKANANASSAIRETAKLKQENEELKARMERLERAIQSK